jgi:carbamoyltransferase
MFILGINAYHGDTSAVLVVDGQLVAAVEEERFTRVKHQAGFPSHAVQWCLKVAGIKPEEVDHIAISRNPNAHLHKKILFALANRPTTTMLRRRLANTAKVKDVKSAVAEALEVPPENIKAQLHHVEHHHAHLSSSFFLSPFEEAALLSVDGFGDFVSTMWAEGKGNRLESFDWVEFPHSLGALYTAVTQYLGFPKYGDEYKVMGLASYGQPEFLKEFRQICLGHEDGSFRLDLDYFVHHTKGASMTWDEGVPVLNSFYSDRFAQRFGAPRQPSDPIEKRHENIAASLQALLEERLFTLLYRLHDLTKSKRLCMAGGVALNATANGKILTNTPFEQVYVQPAAYDAGTALGAAFYVWNQVLGQPRKFQMSHVYWGPSYSVEAMRKTLLARGLSFQELTDFELLAHETAKRLAQGKVVGWFQERMEFGPRALGNRSIVVDPRQPEMKDILNARIKHREPFRPFAPSILEEATGDYFEQSYPSPFMVMTYKVRCEKQHLIPAVTHVDGTSRLQTVDRQVNPQYWQLIKEFEKLTSVPVLLNTSFNENEPIVCTPEEAVACFLRNDMDVLAIGPFFIEREG